jgi:CRISPR-associated protein Csm4
MSLFLYRIRPTAPLHLGAGRADDLRDMELLPRSDTLAAAVISIWAQLRPNEATTVATAPPFAVSSALPMFPRANAWQVLLPMPIGLAEAMPGLQPSQRKPLRQARFADTAILRDLVRLSLPQNPLIVSGCWFAKEPGFDIPESLWTETSRPRLAVNRLGDGPLEGLLYEFGAVHFDECLRLGIAVAFRDKDAQQNFETALRLLGDEGLGADRSSGYGRFEVEDRQAFSPDLGQGMRMTLSLLHPTRSEIADGLLDPPARYDTTIRGGWVTSAGAETLRRKAVRMITEGSVVRTRESTCGDCVRVLDRESAPGLHHDVYRSGVAVTVPIAWPIKGNGV